MGVAVGGEVGAGVEAEEVESFAAAGGADVADEGDVGGAQLIPGLQDGGEEAIAGICGHLFQKPMNQ